MKALKALFVLILLAFSLSAQKLTPKAVEADLLKSFKKIGYWKDKKDRDYDTKSEEELGNSNDAFAKKLSGYAKKYPATIKQTFASLMKEGLTIVTSEDGLFRIYSWDRQTGGTMHFFQNVFQYKVPGGTASLAPGIPEGDTGVYYDKIFTVKSADQSYYLGEYGYIGSTRVLGGGVNVFSVNNGKLNKDAKIIKTRNGLHNDIAYEYDVSYLKDRDKYPDVEFDKASQTIKIPLIDAKEKPTNKFINYKFNGQYFEKVK